MMYKSAIIRYRFRSDYSHTGNQKKPEIFNSRRNLESLTRKFIKILEEIKKKNLTIEEGIKTMIIKKLSEITNQIDILLHYFSEQNHYGDIKYMKFIICLAQQVFLVKKSLNAQFSNFYEELIIHYEDLETELKGIITHKSIKKRKLQQIKESEVMLKS